MQNYNSKIAIDAMGGDFAPEAIVHGAFLAASLNNIPVSLYGDADIIEKLLGGFDKNWQKFPINVFHCSQIMGMDDEPARAFTRKKDSSLVQALLAVAEGRAGAVLSAGNTGAGLVAGMMILERVPGIMRPALGEFLPTKGGSAFCIDLGANVDCKPENLYQFAHIGHVYVELVKNIKNPKIALLSNGAEATKGSKASLQAYSLLEQSALNFKGNIEPEAILTGQADVIVCDGFTGNIMLKTVEAIAEVIPQWIEEKTKSMWCGAWMGRIAKAFIKKFRKVAAGKHHDGALLLGLKHPFIIAHGSSSAEKIQRAVNFAHTIVKTDLINSFNEQLMFVLNTATAHGAHSKTTQVSSS